VLRPGGGEDRDAPVAQRAAVLAARNPHRGPAGERQASADHAPDGSGADHHVPAHAPSLRSHGRSHPHPEGRFTAGRAVPARGCAQGPSPR
jgi:hypothetical protein